VTAFGSATRPYVLEHGQVTRGGSSAELSRDDNIRKAYLGV
jgi:ABC-type branched-subunit amino acid transport system ATPase component